MIETFFKLHANVVVAVSGGVDSAVLLMLAKKYADNVYACFVKSELQPEFELEDAREVCEHFSVPLKVINISALDDSQITANSSERCYYCKKQMLSQICDFAKSVNAVVVEGTNADDDLFTRAGFKALRELGVLSPLRIYGYTKSDIRQLAADNNIPVSSKPSYACLATRIPENIRITDKLLSLTENAEKELFALGFSDFRIRYDNSGALLELTEKDRGKYQNNKENIDRILYKYYDRIALSEKVR